MLVSTAELSDHLDDPNWIVFDCRHDLMDPAKGREAYDDGHINGAHFAGVDRDLSGIKTGQNGRHPLPDPKAFAQFLQSKGLRSGGRVIAYDDVGGQYAARLWWMCRWIGWTEAAVLDGGWPKWTAEQRPVSRDTPAAAPGEVLVNLQSDMLVTVAEVEATLEDPAQQIFDARAPERFRGDVEPLDPIAGHIPGARNRFFKSNLKADLTMKSPSELREAWLAELAPIEPNQAVHQCGSGITACVNLLAMETAGLVGSRLFAGSWSEWVGRSDRPVARGD